MFVIAFEFLEEILDRHLLTAIDQRVRPRHFYRLQFFRGHADMNVRHPYFAEFGLLIPDIENVVGRPLPVRLFQSDAFANARHTHRLDTMHVLVRFILNFDFDHNGPSALQGWIREMPFCDGDVLRSF